MPRSLNLLAALAVMLGVSVGASSLASAQWYARGGVTWLSQNTNDFHFGTIGGNPIVAESNDSYEPGLMFQLGKALEGGGAIEAVYLGANQWNETFFSDDEGGIVSGYSASGHGDNNVATSIARSSEFHSGQLNYRFIPESFGKHNGDLLMGFRYVDFQDRMDLSVTSNFGNDTTNLRILNRILAMQLGMENDIQRGRFSLGIRATGGLGVNLAQADLNYQDSGHSRGPFSGTDHTQKFVAFLDSGLAGGFQLSENLALRGGYLVQVYSGVANSAQTLEANNSRPDIVGNTYTSVSAGSQDALVLHGAFVNLEYLLR